MRLYLRHMGIHFRCAMQHKKSFFMQFFGQIVMALSMMLGVWLMTERFGLIQGFTPRQVLVCFSVNLAGFTLAELFFRGFDLFPGMIRRGDFDRALLRPRSTVFTVLCSDAAFHRAGRLLESVVTLAVVLPDSGICWTAERILALGIMLAGSSALYAALFTLRATVAFFTVESIEFMNIFVDGAREFGAYPAGVYGKAVLNVLTFLIPLACTQYYPLLYLIGRGPLWYALLPLCGFVFWIPVLLFWRLGVRKYRSTGS